MPDQSLTRRKFAQACAAMTATGAIGSAAAAEDKKPAGQEKPDSKEKPDNGDKTSDKSQPESELDLLVRLVQLRYPDERLDQEVLDGIRGELAGDLHKSAVLQAYPLKNSDAPAFVFSAYRGD